MGDPDIWIRLDSPPDLGQISTPDAFFTRGLFSDQHQSYTLEAQNMVEKDETNDTALHLL